MCLEKRSQSHEQPWTSVFTAFPENLSVVQHDPTTDVPGVAFQLGSQLSSRVAGVDEQQVAWLDIDRQRVPLNERKRRRSLPGFQQFCHGILMQVVRIICLGCPASRATVDTPCRIPNSTTDAA
jgi:hypothetical protein